MQNKLYAVYALIVLLVSLGLVSFGYNYGYDKKSAEVLTYQQSQTRAMEALSKEVADMPSKLIKGTEKSYAEILLSTKGKQMYIIDKSGKCMPSKDFEKAYRGLIK